jgi:hypothetical protein
MMLIIAMLNQRGGGTNGSAFSSGDSLFTAHFLPPYLSETLGYRYPESYMDLSRGSIDGSAGAQAHLEDGEKKFDPERKTDRTERLDKNLDKPKESFFFSSSKDKNSQSDKGDKSDVRYAAGSQRGAIPPLGSSLLGQDGLLSRELTHFFYMRFPTLLFSQPPFHLYNALNAGTNNNPDRKSSDGTNSKGKDNNKNDEKKAKLDCKTGKSQFRPTLSASPPALPASLLHQLFPSLSLRSLLLIQLSRHIIQLYQHFLQHTCEFLIATILLGSFETIINPSICPLLPATQLNPFSSPTRLSSVPPQPGSTGSALTNQVHGWGPGGSSFDDVFYGMGRFGPFSNQHALPFHPLQSFPPYLVPLTIGLNPMPLNPLYPVVTAYDAVGAQAGILIRSPLHLDCPIFIPTSPAPSSNHPSFPNQF